MGLYRLLIWLFKTVYNRVIICSYEIDNIAKTVLDVLKESAVGGMMKRSLSFK